VPVCCLCGGYNFPSKREGVDDDGQQNKQAPCGPPLGLTSSSSIARDAGELVP
jgi:hypothetical protein